MMQSTEKRESGMALDKWDFPPESGNVDTYDNETLNGHKLTGTLWPSEWLHGTPHVPPALRAARVGRGYGHRVSLGRAARCVEGGVRPGV